MKSISFNTAMVREIIAGRKTQTRRPILYQGAPSFAKGDQLWVRESARIMAMSGKEVFIEYLADGSRASVLWPDRLAAPRLGQCIPNGVHREGARIFLEIVAARIEPIQTITEQGAMDEGFSAHAEFQGGSFGPRGMFMLTWMSIYGMPSWNSNLPVNVYEFAVKERAP